MINVRPNQMVNLEESFDLAAQAINDGVTAFICAADHQAYELIKGLKKRGINVPEDVSICGFDGVQSIDGPNQLCTVKIPNYDIGYFVAERLLNIQKIVLAPLIIPPFRSNRFIKGNTVKNLNL